MAGLQSFKYRLSQLWNSYRKKREKAWSGLSILVFRENQSEAQKGFRINYYIIFFLSFLLIAIPLSSLVLFIQRKMADTDPQRVLEERRILLNSLHLMANEKEDLLLQVESQLKAFHRAGQTGGQDPPGPLREILAEHERSIQPAMDSLSRDMEHVRRLRQRSGIVLDEMAYYVLAPTWNQIAIHHLIPRGRPLQHGVGMISSGYGSRTDPGRTTREIVFHAGIDFAAAPGTPIVATGPGYVIKVEEQIRTGYGKYVRIHHGLGIISLYSHNTENLVEEGQWVERGDVIALVGRTGRATGNHVHYEVQFGTEQGRDPVPFIQTRQ